METTSQLIVSEITVYVKFTLQQAAKAQRGGELKLYSFFNLGARCGLVVNATPRPLYPGKDTRYPS
jgi:hypothetical protein